MKIGIIGGSGLYNIDLKNKKEINLTTPFGKPSDNFIAGIINNVEIIFLARHGRFHSISPHEINHRANIYAMKQLNIDHIISLSAVGSFKEKLAPLDFVIVDQYVDKTKQSQKHTFFGNGVVAHVSFGEPVCVSLLEELYKIANEVLTKSGLINESGKVPQAHLGGTYINVEGPAFSTKAESLLHKSWGMDIIGMTNLGEARLAREAEIPYNTIAMVTDYDSWHSNFGSVNVKIVIDNLQKNAQNANEFVKKLAQKLPTLSYKTPEKDALANGLFTPIHTINKKIKSELKVILAKYLKN